MTDGIVNRYTCVSTVSGSRETIPVLILERTPITLVQHVNKAYSLLSEARQTRIVQINIKDEYAQLRNHNNKIYIQRPAKYVRRHNVLHSALFYLMSSHL